MRTYRCDHCGSPIDPGRRYALHSFQAHPIVGRLERHPLVEADLCCPCVLRIARLVRNWLADGPDGPDDGHAPEPSPPPTRPRWSPVPSMPTLN